MFPFWNVTYLPIFQIGKFFILYFTYSKYCLSFLWPQLALTYRKSLYQLKWIFLLTAIAGFFSFKNLYFSILYHVLIYVLLFLCTMSPFLPAQSASSVEFSLSFDVLLGLWCNGSVCTGAGLLQFFPLSQWHLYMILGIYKIGIQIKQD